MKNNKYYRVYAEINLDAIVKNVDNLMALTKEKYGRTCSCKGRRLRTRRCRSGKSSCAKSNGLCRGNT